jgi:hypothetical protein
MPRANPTPGDRLRIIEAFQRDEDFILLAGQLNIKNRTAYGIVQRFNTTNTHVPRPRGGAHNLKVDDDIRNLASQFVEGNPLITIKELNAKIRRELPNKREVCDATLSNTIVGMLYTVKAIADIPLGRNTDATKELRREYATWFAVNENGREHVYIDECGFNVWTRRNNAQYKTSFTMLLLMLT